jgi:hypothetical protein
MVSAAGRARRGRMTRSIGSASTITLVRPIASLPREPAGGAMIFGIRTLIVERRTPFQNHDWSTWEAACGNSASEVRLVCNRDVIVELLVILGTNFFWLCVHLDLGTPITPDR